MRITTRNLSYVYPDGTEALRGIDLSVEEGESVLLLGHNGAGKSTLLKHLNGILKPTSGDIFIGEKNTKEFEVFDLVHSVALSFQNPDDQIFSSTVFDETAFGPRNLGKENFTELTQESLQLLGLGGLEAFHPYDLHPSKRKLLTIASAIAMDTPALAFDEPTAGFDVRQKKTFWKTFEILKARNKTVLVVSHDIDYFLELCDSIIILDRGAVSYHGRRSDLAAHADLRSLLRKSGLSVPILWRMSHALSISSAPSSIEEFSHLLLKKGPSA